MKADKINLALGLVALLLYTTLVSCQNERKMEEKQFNDAIIKNLDIDETIKWIVILPGLGCNGCIQEAEQFMKENVGKNEIIFVLTKISSLKVLQNKIDIKVNDFQNVFIDRENRFAVSTNNSIYPCIIKIKDGYIVSHEFQSPQNSQAFLRLKSEML
jgi:hypothetical protein